MENSTSLRLMTYNIGGVKNPDYSFTNVLHIIRSLSPDFLCVQEITEKRIAAENVDSHIEKIAKALGDGINSFFGPTISFPAQFHPGKKLFVDFLFQDIQEWVQGNAFFSRKNFTQLGNPFVTGKPRNLPVFSPVVYQGNRNTDPRNVIISRIDVPTFAPYVLGTHLTTLVGEHGENEEVASSTKAIAQKMRADQCGKIIQMIQQHVLQENKMAILLGDFNAPPDEPCITKTLQAEGQFVRLQPYNQSENHVVDHIFIFPGNNCIEYNCMIVDDEKALNASDHFPVYADITIHGPESEKFFRHGSGVFVR